MLTINTQTLIFIRSQKNADKARYTHSAIHIPSQTLIFVKSHLEANVQIRYCPLLPTHTRKPPKYYKITRATI